MTEYYTWLHVKIGAMAHLWTAGLTLTDITVSGTNPVNGGITATQTDVWSGGKPLLCYTHVQNILY